MPSVQKFEQMHTEANNHNAIRSIHRHVLGQVCRSATGSHRPVAFAQKHLRWTIVGPDSSYSCFEIHICWKVDSDDKIDPPIHTEYLRSGGAMTLIFIVDGASAVSSFVMRSPMPGNVVSWMPLASLPMKLGWNSTSGQRNRSLPTVITLPSGSSYVFSFSELSAAAFISVSKSSATYESFSFTSRTISRSAVVVNE